MRKLIILLPPFMVYISFPFTKNQAKSSLLIMYSLHKSPDNFRFTRMLALVL